LDVIHYLSSNSSALSIGQFTGAPFSIQGGTYGFSGGGGSTSPRKGADMRVKYCSRVSGFGGFGGFGGACREEASISLSIVASAFASASRKKAISDINCLALFRDVMVN